MADDIIREILTPDSAHRDQQDKRPKVGEVDTREARQSADGASQLLAGIHRGADDQNADRIESDVARMGPSDAEALGGQNADVTDVPLAPEGSAADRLADGSAGRAASGIAGGDHPYDDFGGAVRFGREAAQPPDGVGGNAAGRAGDDQGSGGDAPFAGPDDTHLAGGAEEQAVLEEGQDTGRHGGGNGDAAIRGAAAGSEAGAAGDDNFAKSGDRSLFGSADEEDRDLSAMRGDNGLHLGANRNGGLGEHGDNGLHLGWQKGLQNRGGGNGRGGDAAGQEFLSYVEGGGPNQHGRFSIGDGARIDLSGTAITDFDTLMDNAVVTGNGIVLQTGHGSIVLTGVGLDDLSSDNFIFADPALIPGDGETVQPLDLSSLLPENAGGGAYEIIISGLPEGVRLSSGTKENDNSWSLTTMGVIGLTIALPGAASAAEQIAQLSVDIIDHSGQEPVVVQSTQVELDWLQDASGTIALRPAKTIADTIPDSAIPVTPFSGDETRPEDAYAGQTGSDSAAGGHTGLDTSPKGGSAAGGGDPASSTEEGAAEETPEEDAPVEEEEEEEEEEVEASEPTGRGSNDNQAPTGIALDRAVVDENAADGSIVGTAAVTDVDRSETFTYSLLDDAGGRFAIDAVSGRITVADGSLLNHESAASHGIVVRVTDSGGNSYEKALTIAIGDVNEAPTAISLDNATVGESAANGTVVGTATASDPDAGESFTYTLLDDAGGRFAIDAVSGRITVANGSLLNHESAVSHGIVVRVTDSGGNSYEKALTIAIGDVNEAPTAISLDNATVGENAANGTVVGTATASDPDAGESFTYTLLDDAGGRFAIDPVTGQITVADGALLDFESAASHGITVRVTDSGGNSHDQAFTIGLGDVNEAPTDIGLDNATVLENAANGTVVGTAAATDQDSGETFAYTLLDDAGGRFAIDAATGQITVADGSLLNHESAASHGITVRVTDSAGNTHDQALTIGVADVNEGPTAIALSNATVAENAANGTVVGTASASDPDSGETFTYTLLDDAGGRFAIDAVTGQITVADGALLDFESAASHGITVRVTDSGGNSHDQAFTIGLGDVNEAPTDIELDNATVLEYAANGTVVGTAAATDQDSGETFTYSLLDDAGGRFAIDAATGVITVADATRLDYESAASHGITVRVTDSAGNFYDEALSIDVVDVNETPTDITVDNSTVAENAANGTVVGTAAASHPNPSETFTFSLLDDAGGRFAIDSVTGEITVADGSLLDYESAASHGITVRVTDSGGHSYDEALTIELDDSAEHADSYAAAIGAFNPVGYWRLSETSGSTAFDETGTANGSYENNGVIGDGGQAFPDLARATTSFDGSDDFVEIPNAPAWDLAAGTVQLRFKADTLSSTQGLISRDASGQANPGHLSIYLNNDDLRVRLQSTTNSYTINATDVVSPDTWHQVSFSFGSDGMKLYLDGNLVGSDAYTGGIDGNDEPWAVGANTWTSDTGSTSGATGLFDGEIAEVAIFDTQLSDIEIDQLADEGLDPQALVSGTAGDDALSGSAVQNEFDLIDGGDGNDILAGDMGDDRLFGSMGNDTLDGGEGDDFLSGGAGDDVLDGGAGADTLDGGAGTDTASYAAATAGVDARLNIGMGLIGDAAGDTYASIENLTGSAHDDNLYGNFADNVLTAGAGNDSVKGGGGNDTLFGGDGDDTMDGHFGDDRMVGGAGSDVFIFGEGYGTDTAQGGQGGGWTDSITLQNADASPVAAGWSITLDSGTVVSDDGSTMTLSDDSAGTITLTDGSEIEFDGIERIDY